jgi:hypothetical protein
MKIMNKEFLSLKQGSMSVSEYHNKFIQLSDMHQMKLLRMRGSKSTSLKDSMDLCSMLWWLTHFRRSKGCLTRPLLLNTESRLEEG